MAITNGLPIPLEADITRAILDYLRLRGAWVFKVHGHLGQRPGVPDILACYRGRFLAIEVKRLGAALTVRQEAELAAIRGAGGVALVAADVSQAIEALARLAEEPKGFVGRG